MIYRNILIVMLIFEIVCCFFLKVILVNSDYEELILILMSLNSLVFLIFALKYKFSKTGYWLILINYFLKMLLLYYDIVFYLPIASGDDFTFHGAAISVYENWENYPSQHSYGNFLGIIYYLFLPIRELGQQINILFSMANMYLFLRIMCVLEIKKNIKNKIFYIFLFMPIAMLYSVKLLRESIPTFFITLSIYYFICWWQENKVINMYWAIIAILCASYFHSACFGFILGYLIAWALYNFKQEKYVFSEKSCRIIILSIIMLFMLGTVFRDVFLAKIPDLLSGNLAEILVNTAGAYNRQEVGSAYLTSLSINSPLDLLWQSPIRTFYLQFSPMPWDIRNLSDLLVFFLDAVPIYFCLCYLICNFKYLSSRRKSLVFSILLAVFITSSIYGMGTMSSGTAMRHRNKYTAAYFIVLAVALDSKKIILATKRI